MGHDYRNVSIGKHPRSRCAPTGDTMPYISKFNQMLSDAGGRMDQIGLYKFKEALKQPDIKINRGAYYENGPICYQIVDANGKEIASIVERLVSPHLLEEINRK